MSVCQCVYRLRVSLTHCVLCTGYVVLGSNGEWVYLTREERVELVRRVRLRTPDERLVIAGAGAECKTTLHCHCHCLSVCLSVCLSQWVTLSGTGETS